MKNPLIPSGTLAGIEPATFQFVAQHLNHCATAVPFVKSIRLFLLEGISVVQKTKKKTFGGVVCVT